MNRALARGAVWSTWTLGSLFGAWNLFVVHTGLLGNPPSHNQSHAGFQIWGFVFLLLMASRSDVPSRFTLWGTIVAQALITWGRGPADILPGALATLVIGSFLQLAVTLVARAPLAWIASAALLAAGGVEALIERDIDASLRWAHAMYAIALFGAAFPAIHPLRVGAWMSRLGAVVLACGALARSTPAVDVGWILVGLAVYPRPFGLLFSVLAVGYGVADLAAGASSMILDGARHAFTLGVLTLALFEKAGSRWGVRLIAVGTILRQAQVVAALFAAPAWLYVSAGSGFLAAAGVILCGRGLLRSTPSAAPRP